ncbi:UDP-forming cellulose synthase catalytic subunit [Algiphilus sp.]|uniref:UDP-forming cellulose synthase catalytic subunit n=1 Tax=Algiphilus sp. TaxID=1872431 RepID=UPI003C4676F6
MTRTAHPSRIGFGTRLLLACALILLAATGWMFVTAKLALYWQMVVGVVAVIAAIVLKRMPGGWGPSYALMAISTLTTTRYIYWRVTETLPIGPTFGAVDLLFAAGLLAAELYAWLILVLGFFQVLHPLKRKPVPLPDDIENWPTVDVFIPTYNESLSVVRPTILAALDLDWPADKLRVHVLDDGRRDDFARFCERVGARHVTRPDNKHAKAGNINHALTKTDGELIAIFDSDHIPTRSFLQVATGQLVADPRMAMVQTPHHFFSADPFERNLDVFRESPNEGELFYGLLQDGNDYWNATFFCGSCAVIRRTALEGIGGVAVETVTEDAHTSLKMHRQGWRTAYINIPQAAGLATESLSAHIGQRIRWARGMAQIFRLDNPLLGRGLGFGQRLCYATAMLHFFYGFPRLVFLMAPLAFLLLDARIINAQGLMIVSFAVPHLLCAILTNSRLQGNYRHSFFAEVYETVLAAFILLPTTVALIRPHSGAFNVTAKGGIVDRDYFDRDIAKPYLWIFLLNLVGVIVGLVRYFFFSPDVDTLFVTMGWTIFNLILIGAALRVASERRQVRHSVRVACEVPVSIARDGAETAYDSITQNLSYGGAAFHVPAGLNLHPGDRIQLALIPEFAEVWTPATVLRNDKGSVAVAFDALSLQQERQLVYAIYGRADAWLRWRDRTRLDRPWRAFRHVVYFGYEGFFIFLRWLLSSMRSPFRRRTTSSAALLALAAIALGLAQSAPVRAQPDDAAPVTRLGDETRTLSISDLGAESPMRMRNVSATRSLPLSLRDDQVVTDARLELDYRFSPALRPDISQLNIQFNGDTIDSWKLDSETPDRNSRTIAIDPKLFLRYNQLAFHSVASYARDECEDPTHPSLWVEIGGDSRLHVELAALPLRPDLERMPAPFFDAADQRRLRLPVVLPDGSDNAIIAAATTLGSWFGMLADWRGAEFPVSFGALPDTDMHMVAMRTSTRDIDGFEGIPIPEEPEIRVVEHPDNPVLQVLLISARDAAGLQHAVQALAYGEVSMRGTSARVTDFTPPEPLPANQAPRWLSPGDDIALEPFARDGLSASGLSPAALRFEFRLAPHLFFAEASFIDLDLTARAGAGISDRSMLGIRLNGQFIDDVQIHDDSGRAVERDIRTQLPTSALEYRNQLALHFDLIRGQTKYCEVFDPALLRASVDRGLDVDFPRHAYYARLPNLALFADGGFPFTRHADGAEMAFVLPRDPVAEDLSAALTLAGFLGRSTGAVLSRAEVLTETAVENDYDRDLLYVGGSERLSATGGAEIPLPLRMKGDEVNLQRADPLEQMFARMDGRDPEAARTYAARVVHSAGNRLGAIVAAESPFASNRSVVVVTSGSRASVMDTARILLDPGRSQFMGGDVSLADGESVSSYLLGPQYAVGTMPLDWAVRFWIGERPWVMLLLLAFVGLLAIWVLRVLLRGRARRRLDGDA